MKTVSLLIPFILFITTAASAEDFKIAVITELTGAGAAIGQDCRLGAEVAVAALAPNSQLNGFNLSLAFGDSQDDAKTAIAEFNKLTRVDGADVVVVSRSKIALPLNPLSKRSMIPIVGVVAHPEFVSGNPYAVRVYPNAGIEGSFLAEKAYQVGTRRIAVVTVEDEWNLSTSKAFVSRFKEIGGEVLSDKTLAPNESDFTTIVTLIKQLDPDGVFMNLQLSQGGSFIKKLREQGVQAQLYSNYWIQKPEVIDVAGVENTENAMFGEVNSERPKFLKAFAMKFPDHTHSPGTYLCYVGVGTIIDALRETQPHGSKQAFLERLTKIDNVQLLDDVIPFKQREIQYDLHLRALKSGKVTDVES